MLSLIEHRKHFGFYYKQNEHNNAMYLMSPNCVPKNGENSKFYILYILAQLQVKWKAAGE
jgi:hypothetical protein